MKKFSLILFVILMYSHTYAQVNLVPNPSFEIYSSCPTNQNQLYKAFPWYTPTGDTPDYFNVCAIDSTGVGNFSIPYNFWGYQPARTGNAYAGIGLYNDVDEYISVKLDSVLEANKKYHLEFYVSLGSYSKYSIGTIGAFFSDTPLIDYSIITYLPVTPQVENPSNKILSDTTDWMLISEYYTAHGGEQYITIGNFRSAADMIVDTTYPNNIDYIMYYYIDDVSLKAYVAPPEQPQEQLFVPTLLSGQQFLEITGLQPNTQLTVFNTLGQVIYRNSNYANDMSVITFATGVYYYSLRTNEGEVRKGKILIVN